MSSEQTNNSASELARIKARADLLLALYSHAAHDLRLTQGERDRLRDERDEARNELSRRGDELQLVRIELGQSQLCVEEMQKRCEALLNSTSWRLTAPIRTFARLVTR